MVAEITARLTLSERKVSDQKRKIPGRHSMMLMTAELK